MPRALTPELRAWLRVAPARYGVLATIREDGLPSLSVVWAKLLEDDTVLMNTRFDRAKARDVSRDPRVSLCFEDGYQYLTLEGRATLRPDPDLADIDTLRRHYADDKDFSPQRGERVSIVLSVERVLVHLERLP